MAQLSERQIREMAAGPEIDALVAEKVMGWKLQRGGEIVDYGAGWKVGEQVRLTQDQWVSPRGMVLGDETWVPRYSTDIAAAWEVFERYEALGCVDAQRFNQAAVPTISKDGHVYRVYWAWHENDFEPAAVADTASLAICRAALLAVNNVRTTPGVAG